MPSLAVRCEACSAVLPLHWVALPSEPGEELLSLTFSIDEADLAWLDVFAHAHRGPFS